MCLSFIFASPFLRLNMRKRCIREMEPSHEATGKRSRGQKNTNIKLYLRISPKNTYLCRRQRHFGIIWCRENVSELCILKCKTCLLLAGENININTGVQMKRHRYNLGFISDEDIFNHVRDTVLKYKTHINLAEFNSNLVDPVKLTFDAGVYGMTFDEIIKSETVRQIDKNNTNQIGYFHQNIFKYAEGGWQVPTSGFDVVNKKKHIYVEIKNKHNTMNSSSSQATYMKMQQKLIEDTRATCLLVETIAKQSQNIEWKIRFGGNTYQNDRIRRVSMDRFYGMVFGDECAFMKLCKKLPLILEDVVRSGNKGAIENTVCDELKELAQDTLKALYLLAFRTYEGFDKF